MPDPQFSKPTPVVNNPVGSIVGEFIQEKKKERQEEEKARQAAKKRSPFVVPLLVAICGAVWIAPSLMPPREPPVSVETLEHGARLTLYLASLRVREYVDAHKQLPPNLQQAGVDTLGITYQRITDSNFELSTRVQGTRLVYKSSVPDSVFLGANIRIRGIG